MTSPHLRLAALALAAAALTQTAPAQTTATSVLRVGQTLPGGATVTQMDGWSVNRAGSGYAALLTTEPGARKQIWGDFVDDGTTSPQLLFDLTPEAGATVWTAELEDVHEGHVVWNMSWTAANGSAFEAGTYLDGALQLDVFGPGPIPGTTWSGFPVVRRASTGELVVRASLVENGGSADRYLLRLGTPLDVLLAAGQALPGPDGRTITDVVSFELSPTGNHYIAHVRTSAGSDALVVDGARALLGPVFVESGNPAPSEYVAIDPDVVAIGRPLEYAVRDDGDWLALLEFWKPTSPFPRFAARSGNIVSDMERDAKSIAFAGAGLPVVATALGPIRAPFKSLVDLSTATDIDGNGSNDAGWRIAITEHVDADARGRVYLEAGATLGLGLVSGIWRVNDALHGSVVCDGAPNATGNAGTLTLAGSRTATRDDLSLVALRLPPNVLALALVSDAAGFTANPGGSAGNLCLGGQIGRYNDTIGSSDVSGGYSTPASLGAIPRPNAEVPGLAGQTWFFQVWHRDLLPFGSGSNFTGAVEVTLR